MADARAGAWIAAHENLVAADKVIKEHGEAGFPVHALLVGRADVFARMAAAPQEVGIMAGEYLTNQQRGDEERRSAFKAAVQKVRGDDGGTTDTGLQSASGDGTVSGQDADPAARGDG